MPERIIILGTGGNCVDILDTLLDINDRNPDTVYECAGFLDDNPDVLGKTFFGYPVLGPLSSAQQYPDCFFVNGIGSPNTFLRKAKIIASTGLGIHQFRTIVHPTASVSRMANLGVGVVIFQNVTITSNVRIGNHVIILPNSVISHDDVIGDYTCIAGGVCISGQVEIGESSYLGTNSTIMSRSTVGKGCLIGMGSVVLHDVPDYSVMVGNPARLLRHVDQS
jgi:sugar O-acyltransferase (sialic acid O-acetyltransferase NeuD family)